MGTTEMDYDKLIERLHSAGADGDSIYVWNQCVTAADALASLLAENERLKADLDSFSGVASRLADSLRENERLREEREIADSFYAVAMADLKLERAIVDRLREELAAAQKDAERYRHLCGTDPYMELCFEGESYMGKKQFDAAIDASMQQEKRDD